MLYTSQYHLAGTGRVPHYLEYAWVCAPNTAGQAITGNTLTPLTMDTEVSDDDGHGTIAANQVTLDSGVYYYEAFVPYDEADAVAMILSLYNTTSSSYISRRGRPHGNSVPSSLNMAGQFKLSTSSALELRILSQNATVIHNSSGATTFANSTSGLDQRTTLQLWKLDV